MSEPLYFIFERPAYEVELKNRKPMVKHEVEFNIEKCSFLMGMIGL